MKKFSSYDTIKSLFNKMLRGKNITEEEIDDIIDEIMENVMKVASEYGKRVSENG